MLNKNATVVLARAVGAVLIQGGSGSSSGAFVSNLSTLVSFIPNLLATTPSRNDVINYEVKALKMF